MGSVETMGYGLAVLVAVVVFLRIVGKEKAHLERLVRIKQLRAEKEAQAKTFRKALQAANNDVTVVESVEPNAPTGP